MAGTERERPFEGRLVERAQCVAVERVICLSVPSRLVGRVGELLLRFCSAARMPGIAWEYLAVLHPAGDGRTHVHLLQWGWFGGVERLRHAARVCGCVLVECVPVRGGAPNVRVVVSDVARNTGGVGAALVVRHTRGFFRNHI